MSDKRCGTCRWFEWRVKEKGIGWCNHPIPDCVEEETETCMYSHNGTNCPCHERRERDEREGTD